MTVCEEGTRENYDVGCVRDGAFEVAKKTEAIGCINNCCQQGWRQEFCDGG